MQLVHWLNWSHHGHTFLYLGLLNATTFRYKIRVKDLCVEKRTLFDVLNIYQLSHTLTSAADERGPASDAVCGDIQAPCGQDSPGRSGPRSFQTCLFRIDR